MTVVYGIALLLVSVAGVLTAVRLVVGPNALDRIVALDMLVTLIIVGSAIGIAARSQVAPVPVLIVAGLLGFVGSVTAAHLVEKRKGMR